MYKLYIYNLEIEILKDKTIDRAYFDTYVHNTIHSTFKIISGIQFQHIPPFSSG